MVAGSENGEAAIAAAVIVADSRVLLIRRRVEEGSLVWQFPAGKVEPGESGADAAIRESLEETGVVVQAVADLGERVHPATKRTMLYVACELVGGVARAAAAGEVAEVAWCDRAGLADRVPYPLFGPVQAYLGDRLG